MKGDKYGNSQKPAPLAIVAETAPARSKPSSYPEPFFSRMGKREKRPLGDLFGLKNFGVNLTKLTQAASRRFCIGTVSKTSLFSYCRVSRRLSLTSGNSDFAPACVRAFLRRAWLINL